jgi:hypothetical protein
MAYLAFLNEYSSILGDTEGIAPSEVAAIEATYGVKLPGAYKEFLGLFGRKSGYLLSSYLMTVKNLASNRETVEFDLKHTIHNNLFRIESNMFFFAQWQGSVYYFECDKGDDPPIYFTQDFDAVLRCFEKFTDFVREDGLMPLLKFNKLL